MTSNEIKFVRALQQKKFRDESGLFVVEGEKLVAEALASSFRVEQVYRASEIGEKAMERISGLSSPSPVLALVRKREVSPELPLPEKGLFLALDGIRDPGNLGTILRIADWFGLDGIFASPDTAEVFAPKVVQATMGAIFRVQYWADVELPAFCRRMTAAGASVYGTFLDGSNIYERPLSNGVERPSVIVIGNEARGISPAVAAEVSDRLFIPPYPVGESGSESLNAAVATAIAVAEFRRRA